MIRAKLAVEACDQFLNEHTQADGTMTADDKKVYDELLAKAKAAKGAIENVEALDNLKNEMSQPTTKPVVAKPEAKKDEKVGRAADSYKKIFEDYIRGAVTKKEIRDALQEGTNSEGGYLVPEEYDSRLIDALTEENVIRKLGTRITTSGEHKINIAATKPAAAWIEEGGALSFGDATFDQIILDAHKLHVAIKVTEELLYDNAFKLEDYILEAFTKALANAEEDAFINGTGVGQPLGILAETGGAEIGVTSETAQPTADEVISLVYSLKRPYRKNAVFLTNDKCLAYLRTLKDLTGQYLWQPSLKEGEPDRFLGYGIYTSPYFPVPQPGKACVAFGDFSYYNIGDRGTRSFAELKELFAGNGMIGFVAKERVDGKLVLPEAIKLLKVAED